MSYVVINLGSGLGTKLVTLPVLSNNKYITYQKLYNDILSDGHTVAWYRSDASTATMTMTDASVSRWNDILGSGHDLIQATGSKQPSWSSNGVLFDGVNDYMKTAAFTYNQPEMIYMVYKQITWTYVDRIFDGNTNYSMVLSQYATTPSLFSNAGGTGIQASTGPSLDTWTIGRILYNGANSFIKNMTNTIGEGNVGTTSAGAFTLAAVGGDLFQNSNIQVKEIILRNVADNTTDETAIYNYLATKYSIT